MSAGNHPWLVNANNDPRTPLGEKNLAEQSQGIEFQGINGKALRAEINRDMSFQVQDDSMNGFMSAQLSARNTLSGQAQRPPAPEIQNNNTETRPSGFSSVDIPLNLGSISSPPAEESSYHPFQVIINGASASINPASMLFKDLDHTNVVSIAGMGSTGVAAGTEVWLEITFSSWPDTFTAQIQYGAFPAGGEIEDTGGVQTVARIMIAEIYSNAGVLASNPYVVTHLRMWLNTDGGLTINYPKPA